MTVVLLSILLFITAKLCNSFSSDTLIENYPTAHSKSNKVLGMILAFNYGHIDPLTIIFNEYLSMCEGGWEPTVVLFTTVEWSPAMYRYIRQKTFCYRIGRSYDVRLSVHSPSIGTALSAEHRKYMKNEINNFDVFIYHEDDIIFKHSHLVAYLNETRHLHNSNPTKGLWDNTIGFQRYRRLLRGGDVRGGYGEQDIFEQELLEETPVFVPICYEKTPYLRVDGNIHQAVWIFTKGQVLMLEEKCAFLGQSSPSREFMSSFSIFDKKPHYCGLTKLIPAERLTTFSIYHYYQQKHVSWIPVFSADENMRAGYHYYSNPKVNLDLPECWAHIKAQYKPEQYPESVAPPPSTPAETVPKDSEKPKNEPVKVVEGAGHGSKGFSNLVPGVPWEPGT